MKVLFIARSATPTDPVLIEVGTTRGDDPLGDDYGQTFVGYIDPRAADYEDFLNTLMSNADAVIGVNELRGKTNPLRLK